jgi:hypothetical protein
MTKFEQWRAGTNLTSRKAGLSVFGRTKVSHFANVLRHARAGISKISFETKEVHSPLILSSFETRESQQHTLAIALAVKIINSKYF